MVNLRNISVSLLMWFVSSTAASSSSAPRYIALTPSEVCAGISYTHPHDMGSYVGQRPCQTAEQLKCQASSTDSCVVQSPYQAVAKARIDGSKIREGKTIAGVSGQYAISALLPLCTAVKTSECRSNSDYVPFKRSALQAGSIKAGETLLGVLGTYSDPIPLCSAAKRTGCQLPASFTAVDTEIFTEGNIKNGKVIAGVTGKFPSASYPLDVSSPSNPDLTGPTFISRLKSDESFNFFDHTGAQYSFAGSEDLVPDKIRSGVTIFSVLGAVTVDTSEPDFNNVRHDANLYGGRGALKMDCRNAFKDGHNSSQPYPSVDDYGSGEAPSLTKWGEAHHCGMELWEKVTSASCTSMGTPCIYRNKVTGLTWLNDNSQTKHTLANAKKFCGETAPEGISGWRVPTHREFIQAYVHRLRYINNGAHFLDPNMWYWTSSKRPDTDSELALVEMQVLPANGQTQGGANPIGEFRTLCVK